MLSNKNSDYFVLRISETPHLVRRDSKYDVHDDEVKLFDNEIIHNGDQQVCPCCKTSGSLLFRHSFYLPPFEHEIEWVEKGNEYECKNCGKFIYYAQKQKVFRKYDYNFLTVSPFGPDKSQWAESEWRIPQVPEWDGKTCPICKKSGLVSVFGDGFACCTGAYSIYSIQNCPDCGMFVYSMECSD